MLPRTSRFHRPGASFCPSRLFSALSYSATRLINFRMPHMARHSAPRLSAGRLLVALSLAYSVSAQGWQLEGCYTDSVQARSLSVGMGVAGGMTNAKCKDACRAAGYVLAGTEYAGECFCDNQIRNAGKPAPDGNTGCNMACNGNQTEMCGGPDRLTFWKFYTGTEASSSSTAVSSAPASSAPASSAAASSAAGTTSTSATSSSTSSAAPTATGLPAGFSYKGCYVDGPGYRILNNQQPDDQTMTVESCTKKCAQAGYTIAAMEYSYQCFCDNVVSLATVLSLRSFTNWNRSGWEASSLSPSPSATPSVRATKPRHVEVATE